MPYRYVNVSGGQVIESEHVLDHLEGLARWTRTVVESSAPVNVDADVVVHSIETVAAVPDLLADKHADAADVLADVKAELDVEPLPKPTGTGADDRDEWIEYALANGKTETELKGVKTKTIASWFE